jgi:thiosulfate dehydrogenase [quinone] large subunit
MSTRVEGSKPVVHDTAASTWRARALAIGRIALGAYWLWEQHWKLPPEFGIHDARGLMFSFQSSIEHPTIGLYRTFLQDVVVPNFFLFGWLVFIAETLIGLSLTFGLFTKAGGALGTLQSINLLVAQGATEEGPWLYLGLIAANLAATLTPSNRELSIDRVLAPKLRTDRGSSSRLVRLLLWTMGE